LISGMNNTFAATLTNEVPAHVAQGLSERPQPGDVFIQGRKFQLPAEVTQQVRAAETELQADHFVERKKMTWLVTEVLGRMSEQPHLKELTRQFQPLRDALRERPDSLEVLQHQDEGSPPATSLVMNPPTTP
jgi:hypothetical protein